MYSQKRIFRFQAGSNTISFLDFARVVQKYFLVFSKWCILDNLSVKKNRASIWQQP